MTSLVVLWIVSVVALQQPAARMAVDELTAIRELYALASYEAALARLDAAAGSVSPEKAAQYRALCLLGLSRTVEAERAIERLVLDQPGYAMPEQEVSPRLVTMFRDTRMRVLPATARARYTEAKAAYDRQQYPQAVRGFRDVQVLLSDAEFVGSVEGLRDLRVLSEGFLGLAEAEVARSSRPAAVASAPLPGNSAPVVATPAPARAAAAAPREGTTTVATAVEAAPPAAEPAASPATGLIYSDADADVEPPLEVARRLPYWDPPGALARMEFRGQLEVVVSESGEVAEARLVQPVHPQYDSPLIDATTRWRFRPATRGGTPVPYRKTFEIVLSPR